MLQMSSVDTGGRNGERIMFLCIFFLFAVNNETNTKMSAIVRSPWTRNENDGNRDRENETVKESERRQ